MQGLIGLVGDWHCRVAVRTYPLLHYEQLVKLLQLMQVGGQSLHDPVKELANVPRGHIDTHNALLNR